MLSNTLDYETCQSIGYKIKELRKRKKLTQEKLCELIGTEEEDVTFGRTRLSQIENGQEQAINAMSISRLSAMCSVLGCSIGYILGEYECKTYDVQFIHDQTGLRERAINILMKEVQQVSKTKAVQTTILTESLSDIIESKNFPALLDSINEIKRTTPTIQKWIYERSSNQHFIDVIEHGVSSSPEYYNSDEVITVKEFHIQKIMNDILSEIESRYWKEENANSNRNGERGE